MDNRFRRYAPDMISKPFDCQDGYDGWGDIIAGFKGIKELSKLKLS